MDWKTDFQNPPRRYGVYPIIHGDVANSQKADTLCRQGFGGVVGNVRYTRDFPENGAAWQAVEQGVRTYAEKGMPVWIYDEKGYPSGTAGGAVLESHPEYEALGLLCLEYWLKLTGPCEEYRMDLPDGRPVAVVLVSSVGDCDPIDVTAYHNGQGTLRFPVPEGSYYLIMFMERRLYDSTHVVHSHSEPRRYVDLLNPKATEAFIESTYERYAAVLGDTFGEQMPAFFTDEPSLIAWNIPPASYPLLPWGEGFAEIFEKRYGYSVGKALVAVCKGMGPQWVRRRCDYWDLVADLVSQNYFKVLNDWCVAHNTVLSGHLLGEESLNEHIECYGSFYRAAKEMGYTGMDVLGSSPQFLMNPDKIPIARLVASFADVYGRGECMSEASDMIERQKNIKLPLEQAKAAMNWHYAQGVTQIHSYYTLEKYTDEELRDWNRYTARLGLALRQGTRYSRVAVLYPENAMWAAFHPTRESHNGGQSAVMRQVNECFVNTSWALLKRQIDFDYIDERELVGATAADGLLQVRTRRYECVVLPCAYVLSEAAFRQIERFVQAGGQVIAVGRLPELSRETGAVSECYQQVLQWRAEGRIHLVSDKDFSPVQHVLPRTIRVTPDQRAAAFRFYPGNVVNTPTETLSPNILSHVRETEKEWIVFLCNMGAAEYVGTVELPVGRRVVTLNPETGETESTDAQPVVPMTLPAYKGLFFSVEK